jgi:hypothetical protein
MEIETLLNGNILSAKSCKFYFDFIPRRGIVAVDYEEKLDSTDVYDDANDGGPVGSTAGQYSIESMSITFLRNSWNALGPKPGLMQQLGLKAAASLAPGSYGLARFTFTAEYSEPIAPTHTVVDTFFDCRVTGVKDSYAKGSEELVTVVSMKSLRMSRNGLTLYAPVRGFL